MIRTAAVPRPIRIGVAAVGVAGAFALAGCAASDTATEPTTDATATATPESSTTPTPAASASEEASSSSTYADGTYTAEGSYATPESVETIAVTVTLEDDIITAVEVTGDPQKPRVRGVSGPVHRRDRRCGRRPGHRRDLGQPRRRVFAHERRLQPGDRHDQVRSGRPERVSASSGSVASPAGDSTRSARPGRSRRPSRSDADAARRGRTT